MFWSDPNLYGATLPYKDVPMQHPFASMHNIPRFIPQVPVGFMPNLYNPLPYQQVLPQMGVNPWMQQIQHQVPLQYPFVPQLMPHIQAQVPFVPQLMPQFQAQVPFGQQFAPNLPLHNVIRPQIF